MRIVLALLCSLAVASCAARPPLSEAGQKDLIVQYAENDDFIKIFKNADLFEKYNAGGYKLADEINLYVNLCCKTAIEVEKLLDRHWFKVTHKKLTELEQQELFERQKVVADEIIVGHRMAKPYAPSIYAHNSYVTGFYYSQGTFVYSYAFIASTSL